MLSGEKIVPSPFPGMDPFIESQDWEDFHTTLMTVIRESLIPSVRPRYEVRVERRVYVARSTDEPARIIIPDVAVLKPHTESWSEDSYESSNGGGTATATVPATVTTVEPVLCRLPQREEKRETYLTIRRAETKQVITVVEALSPDNKRTGHKGRRKYLRKRNTVIDSRAHLVELDLLRGGARLPMDDPLPAGDYYALICRDRKPAAEVYAWTLRHRLPTIPIPLAEGDADVALELQSVFTTVYDRAGYDYTLDYRARLDPDVSEADAQWARSVLERIKKPEPARSDSAD